MKELALHILDIAENSIRAGASLIEIIVDEDGESDRITIEIRDNGCGMDQDTLSRVLDPFFTTKDVRRVGMGLSLFRRAAEGTGGHFYIDSTPDSGTTVRAVFGYSHIDRQPMGDMASTVSGLLLSHGEIDIFYKHIIGSDEFVFDTRDIRIVLEDTPITSPEVIQFITTMIREKKNLE